MGGGDERVNPGAVKSHEHTDEHGVHHRFRYLNAAPLNDTHFELEVNFLQYWETRPDGKAQHFSWVTDLPIDDANVMALMRGARARWRIENETFNTLKNQGYCFEHNFGHGERHLSTVFAYLMMLAFPHRPVPAALLCAVPGRAGKGRTRALLLGAAAGAVSGLRVDGLGDALPSSRFGYRSEIIIHDTS